MRSVLKIIAVIAITVTFTSYYFKTNSVNSMNNKKQIVDSKQSTQVNTIIKVPSIEEVVNTLSSEEFQGRLVGSEGNGKTAEYIGRVFKTIGLETLFEDSYYQKYYQEVVDTYGGYTSDGRLKIVNNVVGVIKGKEGNRAMVVSAHFDHIGYKDGKLIKGALDNASGVAALVEIANNLKERSKGTPFERDIIIAAFNGEESGLKGSKAFVGAVDCIYYDVYNINIDCIGAKNGGKLALKNKSKVSDKLYKAIKTTMKKHNIDFADTNVMGLSDHRSFEDAGIPNVFIVEENIKNLVHKPTDVPATLDYEKIKNVSNAICDFIATNDGVTFQ